MKQTFIQYILIVGLAVAGHVPLHGQVETSRGERIRLHAERIQNQIRQARQQAEQETTATASLIVSNVPLARALEQISAQSGVQVRAKGEAGERKVTLIARDERPVRQLLNEIAGGNPGLAVRRTAEGFEVWEEDEYSIGARETVVYKLQEAKAEDISALVQGLLTPKTGTVLRDTRLNLLVVNDVPEKQAVVAKVLTELDQKLSTKVFKIQHAVAKHLAVQMIETLELNASQVAFDERTSQILLRATEGDIRRAEALVDAFDVEVAADTHKAAETTSTF